MTSILFGIVRICTLQFKCNYLKNEKNLLKFLFRVWNIHQILNIFEKKVIVIANVFARLQTVKTWVDYSLKSAFLEHPLAVKILMGHKHLWNMHERTFIRFFDQSEVKWLWKYLPYWTLKSYGCLLTHWLAMASIALGILGICSALFKCNYLKKWKLFLGFLFHLWNVHQLSNIFKKKMIVIANVFPKLQTVKYLVKPLSRKLLFRTSFDNQRINGYRTVVKSAREHFYHIFSSLWGEVICKSSALLKFEILLAFGNTLTAGDKYPVWDYDNLQFPIQMQISWKKNFFAFVCSIYGISIKF